MRAFQEALDGRGEVIATDADPLSAAFCIADRSFVAPPLAHAAYRDWVVELCRAHDVGLVLSLLEAETRRLESIRGALHRAGCRLVGAPPGVIDRTEDKILTRGLADEMELRYPRTWTLEEVIDGAALPSVPFMIKPRRGRGSRGITQARDHIAVLRFAERRSDVADWIAQERLEGTEYGVDIVNDLQSRYRTSYQRRKISMRAGETDIAETVTEARLSEVAERIAGVVGHQGCLDADLLIVEGEPHLLDLNVRFGGGYAFSHAAGANLPALLVAWAIGEPIQDAWLHSRPGVTSLRTSSVIPLRVPPTSWKPWE